MSLEQMAPPVDPGMNRLAADTEQDPAVLRHGRELYLTSCAKCHNIEPVTGYTAQEWDGILPKMSKKAKLSDADRHAVRTYILTARRFLTMTPETPETGS